MQGSIYRRRRADGTWSSWYAVIDQPRGTDGGRRQSTTSHRTRGEAQAWLAQTAGRSTRPTGGADLTVGEYLESWLEGKNGLRPSTRLSYRGHLHGYLIPRLGEVRLVDLRAQDVERAYAVLSHPSGQGPVSAATLHRVHATLMSALNTAVRRGLLERNPAATVELPRVRRTSLTTWTSSEASRFVEVSRSDRWGLLYRVMLVTGMRRGEAVALRWSDVDLEEGLLRISRQLVAVGPDLVEGPPKSESGRRTLVLDDRTLTELRLHALTVGAGSALGPEDHVFVRDGQALPPGFVSRHFDRLVASAGLPRIRLHDLRHTSASLGLAAGESLVEVSRRLGHSTIGITADVYTHVDPEVARESSERRADLIVGTGGKFTPVGDLVSRTS
ncbi:tyrosine-type recombinase/integrase [Ornithinimicrobium sp. LYQ121]|uniref:tyrosine-type recombinase/integrase n=1 Tax=Ornithinimicrobium sp. LYQ121 TaxID=3378801 RepID=UPI00385454B6